MRSLAKSFNFNSNFNKFVIIAAGEFRTTLPTLHQARFIVRTVNESYDSLAALTDRTTDQSAGPV